MFRLAPLALAGCLLAAGCAESDQSGVSPSGSTAVLDALAGAWTLGPSSPTLPAGCSALDYTVDQERRRQVGQHPVQGRVRGC